MGLEEGQRSFLRSPPRRHRACSDRRGEPSRRHSFWAARSGTGSHRTRIRYRSPSPRCGSHNPGAGPGSTGAFGQDEIPKQSVTPELGSAPQWAPVTAAGAPALPTGWRRHRRRPRCHPVVPAASTKKARAKASGSNTSASRRVARPDAKQSAPPRAKFMRDLAGTRGATRRQDAAASNRAHWRTLRHWATLVGQWHSGERGAPSRSAFPGPRGSGGVEMRRAEEPTVGNLSLPSARLRGGCDSARPAAA